MSEQHDEREGQGRPNKTAQKREIAALVALAERMLTLTDAELQRLDVEPPLRDALNLVRPMRASGARNRQLKHCVKFMPADDLAQVRAYLDDRQSQRVASNRAFHAAETWRDRLIAGGDEALGALLEDHADSDRQRLRQLMRDAAREAEGGKPAGAGRRLFRFLRDEVLVDNSEKN